MSPIDVIIVLAVVAVTVLCVRAVVSGKADGCSTCGETGCSARNGGGRCKAADDMLRRANEAFGSGQSSAKP
ncbi:FeoB-associated Cys-rich membrane protein [Olsenella sp. Marseille-P4559]|jgi:hypothetical protein|uniref:FeoB-associated Cys-rich membrane protein n=1 Tax=Olsenella sp. Marseille-P4559 TaxID=2364795 RepID=UPI001030A342|nr:FeoB-associated Cys-rich membrane protein [Olsenella sp. Marseille-P4559]